MRYRNVKTGEEWEEKEKHDFFWIPMQYWSALIAGMLLYAKLLGH
ncbi:hypothetical protein [Fibrella aquatilis]|nr:hypothetical protein [Fibrella aquatilis]